MAENGRSRPSLIAGQSGGIDADGNRVVVNGAEELAPGTEVLLFLHYLGDGATAPFVVVGTGFGQFVLDGDRYLCDAEPCARMPITIAEAQQLAAAG